MKKRFIILSVICISIVMNMHAEMNANGLREEKIMKHMLPPLPYDYKALEPYLDEQTMIIHHTKHHQAYVDNLNKTLESYPKFQHKSVEELITALETIPEAICTAVRNNGGGHLNHSLFWKIMGRNGGSEPKGKLGEALKKTFGSFEKFKKLFSEQAKTIFGSGWMWLSVDQKGELAISSTSGHDTPLMHGHRPILVLDVWEHAYYLKYQNRRSDFIDAWWHVVNWPQVEELYSKI